MKQLQLEQLILAMYDNGMIKFGEFALKSGKQSYIYADIRTCISYPEIYRNLCDIIYKKMRNLSYDYICGVPYSALTFASSISYTHAIPMLLKRKETKDYGTKKMLEGDFNAGQSCLLIEDVITTGKSILETIEVLAGNGLMVTDIVSFVNRNQGGTETLMDKGYKLHTIIDLIQIIDILFKNNKINKLDKEKALSLIY